MEETENMIPLSNNQLHFTEISANFYPVLFISVEKLTTCLVIANNATNYVKFLKVKNIDHTNNVIEFNSMGLSRNYKDSTETASKARIVQFVSVWYKNSKEEVFQASMSLLSDGILHFYVDFGRILHSSR